MNYPKRKVTPEERRRIYAGLREMDAKIASFGRTCVHREAEDLAVVTTGDRRDTHKISGHRPPEVAEK